MVIHLRLLEAALTLPEQNDGMRQLKYPGRRTTRRVGARRRQAGGMYCWVTLTDSSALANPKARHEANALQAVRSGRWGKPERPASQARCWPWRWPSPEDGAQARQGCGTA
jgi:hypothetical protein